MRQMKIPHITGIAALLLMTGCHQHTAPPAPVDTVAKEIKQAPPTPIDVKRVELGGTTWDPAWDRIVEEALPQQLLSPAVARDVRVYCPRFNNMSNGDKRAYWAYFFQALAGAEAGLEPTTNVRHTEPEVAVKDAVTKGMVHSEGLLQLTYMDAKRYGCDFDYDKDKGLPAKDPSKTILQPRNNLECGVKILENQLIDQHKPLLSRSSYWSTLRPGTPSFRVFAKQMTNVPSACRVAPVSNPENREEASNTQPKTNASAAAMPAAK